MIENLFNKTNDPIILQDCTLFIGLDYYDIGTTYIFSKYNTKKVEQFGNLWIKKTIRTDEFNRGYFSSLPYVDFAFSNKLSQDGISIIGYYKNGRYIVEGIDIEDNRVGFGDDNYFVANFSFYNIKLLR